MNILVKLLVVSCCVLALPLSLEGGCKTPRQGPQGEPGPPFAVNFASAYSQGTQIIPSGAGVAFFVNRVVPVGVAHSGAPEPTWFRVLQDGIYYVSWTFTAQSVVDQTVSVNIRNVSTNNLINPTPYSVQTIPAGEFSTISGSAIIPLLANMTLALEVSFTAEGNTAVIDPSLNIFQIAPLAPFQLGKVR